MQQPDSHNTAEPQQNLLGNKKRLSKDIPEESFKTLLKSLKNFSKDELEAIQERTESLIKRREKAERKNALREAKEIIKKHNFSPEELTDNST